MADAVNILEGEKFRKLFHPTDFSLEDQNFKFKLIIPKSITDSHFGTMVAILDFLNVYISAVWKAIESGGSLTRNQSEWASDYLNMDDSGAEIKYGDLNTRESWSIWEYEGS